MLYAPTQSAFQNIPPSVYRPRFVRFFGSAYSLLTAGDRGLHWLLYASFTEMSLIPFMASLYCSICVIFLYGSA